MSGLPMPDPAKEPEPSTWWFLVPVGAQVSIYGGLVTAGVGALLGSLPVAVVGLWLLAIGIGVVAFFSWRLNREEDALDAELDAFADVLAEHYGLTYVTRPDLRADAFNDPDRQQQLITVRRNDDDVIQHVIVTYSSGRVVFLGPTDDTCEYPAARTHVAA